LPYKTKLITATLIVQDLSFLLKSQIIISELLI